jgi:hypothetical protein
MSASKIPYDETKFGFLYGAADITRVHADEKTGKVFLELNTLKGSWQIHVTKTGKVRIFGNSGELLPTT